MEEDIEILEELIQHFKGVDERTLYNQEVKNKCKRNYTAIENLIKGYKEKEEELKKEKDKNQIIMNDNINDIYESCLERTMKKYIDENIAKDFISKEIIKDKIKEIYEDKNNRYYDMFFNERDIEKTIQVLGELLKED